MNSEEIIEMAIDANLNGWCLRGDTEGVLKFAALVIAKEREECAKVCEMVKESTCDLFKKAGAYESATAIRARGAQL